MHEAVTAPPPAAATSAWLTQLLAPLAAWSARAVRQAGLTVDPRDVAQEAVCRMVAAYGAERLAATSAPVLRAIAWRALRNLVVDESRRGGRIVFRDVVPEVADPEPAVDARLESARAWDRLASALERLRADEREFVLAVMRLDSVPAAQKAVGWPRASPYYHLRLILERLRDGVIGGAEG